MLALRADRTSTVFRVARLTGVVAITITFVVFHVAMMRCGLLRVTVTTQLFVPVTVTLPLKRSDHFWPSL